MLLATLDRRVKKWVSSYKIRPMTLNNMIFLSHRILLLLPPPLPRVMRLGRQQHDEVLFERLSYFDYDVAFFCYHLVSSQEPCSAVSL